MSARYLRRDGLRVRLVTSPEPTLAELTGGPDAAAVIDLTMPGLDPRRIRRALRTPVIFLVADVRAPRPRGLAVRGDMAGARRWLARPFSPRQLVALVRDVLADPGGGRAPGIARPYLEPPPTGARRAAAGRREPDRSGGRSSRALPQPSSRCSPRMLENPGRVLSRRQLLAAAGRHSAGDRAADVYVAQLRAKLGPAWPIRTVRAAGYAWTNDAELGLISGSQAVRACGQVR